MINKDLLYKGKKEKKRENKRKREKRRKIRIIILEVKEESGTEFGANGEGTLGACAFGIEWPHPEADTGIVSCWPWVWHVWHNHQKCCKCYLELFLKGIDRGGPGKLVIEFIRYPTLRVSW